MYSKKKMKVVERRIKAKIEKKTRHAEPSKHRFVTNSLFTKRHPGK